MRNLKLPLILFFLLIFSCRKNDNDYIFQNRNSLENLPLNEIVSFEKSKGSKERFYDNTFQLGQDYYPNKLKFKLANPRIFERMDKELFMESDYFYNAKDSLVKVAFYTWKKNQDSQDTLRFTESPNFKVLQKKYNRLKIELTNKLGKSNEPKLGAGCYLSLISCCEWKNQDMKAYLSIHTSEIRLAIYSK